MDVTATLGHQQAISAGTGMVLTPSGLASTNNHVVEGATAITVTDGPRPPSPAWPLAT